MAFLLGAQESRFRIEKVADGVYAALQPAALRFEDSNSAVVILDDGVLVVDSQISPVASAAVLAEIRKLTDQPVRYVVNTHWHGDHVQGNSTYHDAFPIALFLAHHSTREDIEKRAAAELKEQLENLPTQIERAEKLLAGGTAPNGQPLTEDQKQLRGRIERYKLYLAERREVKEFVLPTLTFEESLTLHRGDREIQLLHFSGHTRGDLVVYLPRQKVLITGDLLDDLPYAGDGSPAALVKTLRKLEAMDWDTMIPGHGSVYHGKEHLRLIANLFESLVSKTEAAARAGLSVDEALKKVNLDSFRDPITHGDGVALRYWNFFMSQAIKRAYAEATGQAKDESVSLSATCLQGRFDERQDSCASSPERGIAVGGSGNSR